MSDSNPHENTRVAPRSGHTPAPEAPTPLPPGSPTRIGRFELRSMLGEGAFGRVFRGYDAELRREVAIKVPHTSGLNDEFRERFIREARAIAAIHHPNVCPVYEVGTDGVLPFIVMRFVAGTTLANVIDRLKTPMPPRNAVMILRKLALGMAAAHAEGVTHRDLKPANILYDTANREVLITDFGLARVGGEMNLTAKDSFLGTPAYTSPEQANRKADQVGPLSDVYSLGVILYEMLTGDVPFTGSVMEVAIAHCISPPDPPSTKRPGIDAKLDAIVLKAMAKSPSERFRSAREFSDVLTEYLRPGDPSAGQTGSVGEMPVVALGGGREPEAATETVAEKRSGRRTAPALEVAPAPAPVIELDEDEEVEDKEAAKEARRSGARKSAKQSKGGKKKKGGRRGKGGDESPLLALLQNKMVMAGAGVFVVLLFVVVVLLTRNKPEKEKVQNTPPAQQTPAPQPVVPPKVDPRPEIKPDPKEKPKDNSGVAPGSAEDRLRNKLLDRWRATSGPGLVDPALLKRWEVDEKYFYVEFKSDTSVLIGVDSFDPNVRIQMAKTSELTPTVVRFQVINADNIEFLGVPARMQLGPFGRGERVHVRIDGDSLILRYTGGTAVLKRVVLTR